MKHENEFILNACKYLDNNTESDKKLNIDNLNMPYILGQLLYNRIGGVAYYTLVESNIIEKMNREFKNTLQTIYETNIIKRNNFKQALNLLSTILKNVDFPYALLKGSYLQELYPSGLRTSNDIDILIEFENITYISNLLKQNGFKQGYIRNNIFNQATRAEVISSQMNRGETIPFVKELNFPFMKFLEIDINISLDFKPEKDKSLVKELLKNCCSDIKTENGTLNTLSKDDFLIQLCCHLYKEATTYNWVEFGRDQGLYKYLDIYMFLKKFPDVLNHSKIISMGLEKECYYAIFNTSKLFNLDITLDNLNINDTNFMNMIFNIQTNKSYVFDMDIIDWVFCEKRGKILSEIDV